MCEVYELNVRLGKETIAFKGKQKLADSAAFNRVFTEMLAAPPNSFMLAIS